MTEADRADAIRRLGIRRSPDDVPALTAALDDPAAQVRVMACRALGWQRTPGLAAVLLDRFDDPAAPVRAQAIHALGICLGRRPAPPAAPVTAALINRLDDPDPDVRAAAARMCGWLQAVAAARSIRRCLVHDVSDGVRAEAAHAAGRLGDHAAVPALVGALSASHAGLRHQAARALGALHAEGSRGALAACATDADPEVRAAALRALARLGATIAPLLAGLGDENPGVRATAAIAVGQHPEDAGAIEALRASVAIEHHPEARHHMLRALIARGAPPAGTD